MMELFKFGEKWRRWIEECVTNAKVSVLVNGSPTKEFSPKKGLRQGDPLSPFLFTIVVEGLNLLMIKARELGIIKGASVGQKLEVCTHLQFADDTILFCETNWEEVVSLKRILRCFEVLSGLRINYHKSVVCGVGVSDSFLHRVSEKVNCLSRSLPIK